MNLNPQQSVAATPFSITSWSGGMNTTSAPDRLADNEALYISNFRFGEDDSLISRPGTTMVLEKIGGADITSRITSYYQARFQDGSIRELFTKGNKIYEIVAGVATDRTGAAAITSDRFWQWKMYADIAIGVTNGDLPYKMVSGTGNVAALGGITDVAKFIEIWNDRVWVIGAAADTKNTLFGSKLGDPEDWTVTGLSDGAVVIDIEPDDGDQITGIYAFRGRLFIFKRNRIYTVQAVGGAFPTDATALAVELYTASIGCVSAYTIQSVVDDVLFMSPHGIASLVASQTVGDFNAALLSNKISGLRNLAINKLQDVEITAMHVPEHNQYWVLVPGGTALDELVGYDQAYVLDYRRLQEGIIRWTTYSGTAAGLVMAQVFNSSTGNVEYRICGRRAGSSNIFGIYKYVPLYGASSVVPNDNTGSSVGSIAIYKYLRPKMIDCNLPYRRKEFDRLFFDLLTQYDASNLGQTTTVTVTYYLDNDVNRNQTLMLTLPAPTATSTSVDFGSQHKVNRKLKYSSIGRRGVIIDFVISNNSLNETLGIKGLTVFFFPLPEKRATYL